MKSKKLKSLLQGICAFRHFCGGNAGEWICLELRMYVPGER